MPQSARSTSDLPSKEIAAPAQLKETFLPMDRPAAPSGVELNSDAAWEEFQLLSTQTMAAMTEAAAQALVNAEAPAGPDVEHLDRLQDVTTRIDESQRACPKPREWFYLYQLLLSGAEGRRMAPPPNPPIEGPAWRATSAATKKMCFLSHIKWASEHDLLDAVSSFLDGLPEERWLHLNNQ